MQNDLREILDAGIAAADPYDAVKRYLEVEDYRVGVEGDELRGREDLRSSGR